MNQTTRWRPRAHKTLIRQRLILAAVGFFFGGLSYRLNNGGGARLRVGLDDIQRHQHYPEHHHG
jgi:hypothetical protein